MATTTAAHRQERKKPRKSGTARHAAERSTGPFPQTPRAKTVTKTTDNKGRVVLGGRFANRAVIIQELSDTEVVIKLARVIPESEAWLYENPEALAAVRTGLAQARAGEVTRGPDVDADTALAAKLGG